MKISDYKREKGIELWAEIIEPATEIFSDAELREAVGKNANRLSLVKLILKNHPKEIIEIMARLDGADPETYEPNMFRLPAMLLEIFNDEDFTDLFQSQGQMMGSPNSGSATENTEEAQGTF